MSAGRGRGIVLQAQCVHVYAPHQPGRSAARIELMLADGTLIETDLGHERACYLAAELSRLTAHSILNKTASLDCALQALRDGERGAITSGEGNHSDA